MLSSTDKFIVGFPDRVSELEIDDMNAPFDDRYAGIAAVLSIKHQGTTQSIYLSKEMVQELADYLNELAQQLNQE